MTILEKIASFSDAIINEFAHSGKGRTKTTARSRELYGSEDQGALEQART